MFASDLPLVANQVPISLDFPSKQDELNLFVQMLFKRFANAINSKESGLYVPVENAAFISYFTPTDTQRLRNVYRKTFDMVKLNGGVIAPGSMLTFPHGITTIVTPTRIYGTATNTTPGYLPLPYVSLVATENIQIFLNNTVVGIFVGATQLPLTQAYITFEWTKN